MIGSFGFVAQRDKLFWLYFITKVGVSVAFFLLYKTFYQAGDIFSYIENLKLIYSGHDLNYSKVYEVRTIFFTKLIYPIYFLSNQSSFLTNINLAIINAIATVILIKELSKTSLLPDKILTKSLVLFFPSIMFWTAGISKETVSMSIILSLCSLMLYGFRTKREILVVIPFILLSYILFQFKFYQAVITIPFIIGTYLSLKLSQKVFFWSLFGILVLLILMSFLHPYTHPYKILEAIKSTRSFTLVHGAGDNHTNLDYQISLVSFFKNVPIGLFHGLFSPLKAWNTTSILAMIENITVISTITYIISQFKKIKISDIGILVLIFIAIYAIITGIACPYYGSLIRIRVAYYLFGIILLSNGLNLVLKRNSADNGI